MAWTTPRTWSVGEVLSASLMNTHVRDNLNYLLSGRPIGFVAYNKAGSFTTSGTTFADVDATNLKTTFTPQSSRILTVWTMALSLTNVAAAGEVRVVCSNPSDTGSGLSVDGSLQVAQNTNLPSGVLIASFTGLTPGISTSVRLQFRVTNGAATLSLTSNMGNAAYTGGLIFGLVWEY